MNTKFDEVDFLIAHEGGTTTQEEDIEGFQHLVDSGHAWTLQGYYGRTARSMIEAGLIHAKR